ncbi:MAG: alpha/beta fold hydrolase [Vicinamibacteria bacterium]|nr:alpha/beta fold hydrolase [Vicinamibacteria bacterium]
MAMIGAMVRGVDLLSPRLGARVAARLFLTPRRARLPERESEWLTRARPETFAAGRFRLAGHRWGGAGEPVLLVHGWEGRGSQLGGLALALVNVGFQPITIDLPAHGSSRGAQTNLLEFAEVVSAMVKQLGGVAGIVAHSFGAAGTTVALREPISVGRLVYLAPCEDFDHFPRVFSHWLGLPAHLSDRMRHSVERRLGTTMAALRGKLLAPEMRAPLLVVHDEDDKEVPWQDGKTYSEAWPDSRLLTTRGLGHRRILREASVLASVADFFQKRIASITSSSI